MARMKSLWGRLDKVATAANAEAVLLDYQHRKARAQSMSLTLQSPRMDGMPRSRSVDNPMERKIVNQLADQDYLQDTDYLRIVTRVLECIEDDRQRDLLRFTYIAPLASVTLIAERVHLSHATYYREKEKALISFAERWPPLPSPLLVYR